MKIKLAIVGLNFGEFIIHEITQGGGKQYFELAAVCDLNVEKAKSSAEKYGVKCYPNLDSILLDDEITVIGLYTPPVGRAELMDRIISAGKHIMTTKPFELDALKGINVLRKARELGKIIHLNSPSPLFSPELQLLNEWHAEYNLGRSVACRADVWCNYREKYNGTWYDDPIQCPVAPIFRIGIYLINDLVRLFGEAEEVQVMQSRIFTERPTPDNAQLAIKHKNGAISNIFASFCVDDGQSYKNSLVINYEKGTIYKNIDFLETVDLYSESDMMLVTRDKDNKPVLKKQRIQGSSGQYQWGAMHRALNGEILSNEVTPEEIIEGIKIINAMAKAEKFGRSQKV